MEAGAPSLALRIFVYAAWIISCLSLLLTFCVRASHKLSRFLQQHSLSPWSFSTSVLAVGTYLLILSQEMSGIVNYDGTVPIIDSALNTIRMFGARGGNTIQAAVLARYFPENLCHLYELTHSLARLAAPVDTLMGIFILVSNLTSSPKLRLLSSHRDTYIFSHLNDQSLLMATSIKAHYEAGSFTGESAKCLVAFANTANMKTSNLMEQALSKGTICTGQPINSFIGVLPASTRRRVFVLSGADEMINLQDGMTFVQRLFEREAKRKVKDGVRQPEVFIVSSSPAADTFVDASTNLATTKEGGRPLVSVRRIDRLRSTIESFLWDYPLFLVAKPSKTSPRPDDPLYAKRKRRIAIVGSGTIGCEFLKAAAWCSQMDGIKYSIDVIDKNINPSRDRFAMEAPEVMRLSDDSPQAEYDINFLSIDAEGVGYLDYLKSNRDELTYLIIALGDKLLNVKVARRTREILEQGRFDADRASDRVAKPFICCIIDDKRLADAVSKMATSKGVRYDIVPIGVSADTYSYENLFMPDVDIMGRNVNRAYWGYYDLSDTHSPEAIALRRHADASYESSEYSRRSSRATAIHLKYNLFAYHRRRTLLATEGQDAPAISTVQWQGELSSIVTDKGKGKGKGTDNSLTSVIDDYQQYVSASSPDELRWLSKMEHDRWAAYVRSEGYECANEETFLAFFDSTRENQNRLSKQHVCLVPFEDLQEASDFVYPHSNKASDLDYERLDDQIVLHLADIVRDTDR